MIYKITIWIVRGLLVLLNGFGDYQGREKVPKDTGYVLVAPHRSWLDPVMMAIAVYPQPLVLMAIKYPVQQIKENQKALVIFPTGTRYSNEMKGGAVMIARLAKAPIVPMVYQGPLTFKDIIKRKKMHVRIGDPIYIADQKLTKEEIANYDQVLIQKFDELDKEIDPNYVYELPVKKIR